MVPASPTESSIRLEGAAPAAPLSSCRPPAARSSTAPPAAKEVKRPLSECRRNNGPSVIRLLRAATATGPVRSGRSPSPPKARIRPVPPGQGGEHAQLPPRTIAEHAGMRHSTAVAPSAPHGFASRLRGRSASVPSFDAPSRPHLRNLTCHSSTAPTTSSRPTVPPTPSAPFSRFRTSSPRAASPRSQSPRSAADSADSPARTSTAPSRPRSRPTQPPDAASRSSRLALRPMALGNPPPILPQGRRVLRYANPTGSESCASSIARSTPSLPTRSLSGAGAAAGSAIPFVSARTPPTSRSSRTTTAGSGTRSRPGASPAPISTPSTATPWCVDPSPATPK